MTLSALGPEIRKAGNRVAIKGAGILPQEKNKWPMSFLLAAGLHLLFLFGGHLIIFQPAGYGIQASAGSIDVYMVAALPQSTQVSVERSEDPLRGIKTVGGPSDMAAPQTQKNSRYGDEVKNSNSIPADQTKKKSKAHGDGSSQEPGEDKTTLFSSASAEVLGKAGKYKNPPPAYPLVAQRQGWEGVVTLRVFVQRDGKPGQIIVEQSSGRKILDDAALTAVKKWLFKPAEIGSTSFSSWVRIPIRFTLTDEDKN